MHISVSIFHRTLETIVGRGHFRQWPTLCQSFKHFPPPSFIHSTPAPSSPPPPPPQLKHLVNTCSWIVSILLRLAQQREQYLQDRKFDVEHYRDALNAQVRQFRTDRAI